MFGVFTCYNPRFGGVHKRGYPYIIHFNEVFPQKPSGFVLPGAVSNVPHEEDLFLLWTSRFLREGTRKWPWFNESSGNSSSKVENKR